MGTSSSKHAETGVLQGAYAPPIDGVAVPNPPEPPKEYEVTIPPGLKKGDTFLYDINGHKTAITVPSKDLRRGDTMMYRSKGEIEKVVASTLHSIPGFVIVQSKPVIWS